MNEQTIFLAALEIVDPTERQAYVLKACAGDESLGKQVESLLEAHHRCGEFLDVPALEQMEADTSQLLTSTLTLELKARGEYKVLQEKKRLSATDTVADPFDEDGEDRFLDYLQPSTRPGALGRLGHYEVLEVLGQGGFATVVKAFDEKLHRMVAIKIMSSQMASTSPARKRFLREARSAAAVRHENVVDIHAIEEQPIPYLVMECIAGKTLQQKLDEVGPLDVTEVLRIGVQIARGLAAAHALGLIHRDIKPSNILLENGVDRVKISDFGLARAADDASVTQTGLIAGTPMYMSPEQANGTELDCRADLFSLGSVLYVMCSGRPPFRAATTLAVLKRVTEDSPRPIRDIIPEIPDWLCSLIARLHAKNPDDRFSSAQEVAELLAKYLAELHLHGTVISRPVPSAMPAMPIAPAPRRAWLAMIVALAVGLSIVAMSEALGVTQLAQTAIRVFTPEGTLVVQVDDPDVKVSIEGTEVLITGAGLKEIRLKPGQYKLLASADGKQPFQKLVEIEKNGRNVVRVTLEPIAVAVVKGVDPKKAAGAPDEAWMKAVAAMSAMDQVNAVGKKMMERNPGFDGTLTSTIQNDKVLRLEFKCDQVYDVSPVRALVNLKELHCAGSSRGEGILEDLRPLAGMSLTHLVCRSAKVKDLTPLKDMPLTYLDCGFGPVKDLSPVRQLPLTTLLFHSTDVPNLEQLRGMKLTTVGFDFTAISDLSPLEGMPLTHLSFQATPVASLTPIEGMPLVFLNCLGSKIQDLSPLKKTMIKELLHEVNVKRDAELLRSIKSLETINGQACIQHLKELEDQQK